MEMLESAALKEIPHEAPGLYSMEIKKTSLFEEPFAEIAFLHTPLGYIVCCGNNISIYAIIIKVLLFLQAALKISFFEDAYRKDFG